MRKSTFLGALMFCCITISFAKPPKPPKGFRWVINEQFSDEFNGDRLDHSKWMNQFNGGWKGRAPAWFNPEAVFVEDGNLKIKSGVLKQPKGKYTMYGGAVSSRTREAHFGYYECKAKASKIAMSTTFWMSNDKVPFTGNDDCEDDSYSQELDIQEAVGGSTKFDKFKNGMNCNTHYRYVKCGERKETFISKGTGHILDSPVYADYHIYGAWWKNAEEVMFYADDELFDTVAFRKDISKKPFDRPMQINMVTETYDWQPAPSVEDLENQAINTAYYDWVRSYRLVPIHKKIKESYDATVFENTIAFSTQMEGKKVMIDYEYASNEDARIVFTFLDSKGREIKQSTIPALKGYGYYSHEVKIKRSDIYQIKARLLSSDKGKIDISFQKKM